MFGINAKSFEQAQKLGEGIAKVARAVRAARERHQDREARVEAMLVGIDYMVREIARVKGSDELALRRFIAVKAGTPGFIAARKNHGPTPGIWALVDARRRRGKWRPDADAYGDAEPIVDRWHLVAMTLYHVAGLDLAPLAGP